MSRVEIEKDGVKLGVIDELEGTITLTTEGAKRMTKPKEAKKGTKKGGYGQYPPKSSPKPK